MLLLLVLVSPLMAGAKEYPQRIVSLGPLNTENIFLLGAGDRLVANTRFCVRPEAAKQKEKIGSVMLISVEKIIILQPDLILATALTNLRQIEQLRRAGIKVVQFKQPASFADICNQFIKLGYLLGRDKLAKQIIRQTQDEVKAIQKQVSHLPEQRVFLQVGRRPLFSSVKNSFTHDYIVLANGFNIAENQSTGAMRYEQVVAKNPDVIIIAMMGSETGMAAEEKKNWQSFQVIEAVRNNRVHTINPNLALSPSPASFVQALRIIAELIHPKIQ